MEKRMGNIIVQKPGGTAGKHATAYKLSLPTLWVKEMGLLENRQVQMCFDGEMITIKKKMDMKSFTQKAKEKNHEILLFTYYDGEKLCSRIAADYTEKSICVENYVADALKRAFGNMSDPGWEDFLSFLETRCIPKERAGLREYLDAIGAESYDPLEIIRITGGRMAEDQQWLKVEVPT